MKLNELTGWDIVTVSDDETWYHAGNRMPDGSVVDILGVWLDSDWTQYWEKRQREAGMLGAIDFWIDTWTAAEFKQEIIAAVLSIRYDLTLKAAVYAEKITQLVAGDKVQHGSLAGRLLRLFGKV